MLKSLLFVLLLIEISFGYANHCVLVEPKAEAGPLSPLTIRLEYRFPTREEEVSDVIEILKGSNIDLPHCCEGGNLENEIMSLLESTVAVRPSREEFQSSALDLIDKFEKMQNQELARSRPKPKPNGTADDTIAKPKTLAEIIDGDHVGDIQPNRVYELSFDHANEAFSGPQRFIFSPEV
jgi:hypothetical protein